MVDNIGQTNPYPFGYPPYAETVAPMEQAKETAMTINNTAPATGNTSTIWSAAFWKGAGERAIKTAAQTFVAVVGVTGVGTTLGFHSVNWVGDLSVTGVATILSIVTSLGNASFTAGKP